MILILLYQCNHPFDLNDEHENEFWVQLLRFHTLIDQDLYLVPFQIYQHNNDMRYDAPLIFVTLASCI